MTVEKIIIIIGCGINTSHRFKGCSFDVSKLTPVARLVHSRMFAKKICLMNLAQIQLKDLFEEGTNFNAC